MCTCVYLRWMRSEDRNCAACGASKTLVLTCGCGKMVLPTMSERTFTLDEAQSLLPVLESLLRAAIAAKKTVDEADAEQQALQHRVFLARGLLLDIVPLARKKAERAKAEQRVKDALAEIDSIGVQVKDLDIGLLDFPCE